MCKIKTIGIDAMAILVGAIVVGAALHFYPRHNADKKDAIVSYVGDPDYKDGDEITRPLYTNRFSIMCYSGESCVLETVKGKSDVVYRFPYISREWMKDGEKGKPMLMTLPEIKTLPSFNGNPDWKCDTKSDCELVIEAAKRIGW